MTIAKFLGGIAIAATLAGCAQNPDAIQAADVSRSAYNGVSCQTLRAELYETESGLGQLEAAQRAERNKDTAWVTGGALLFFPAMVVAAAGEDHTTEIARMKGERNAMRSAMISRGC